MAKIDNNNSEGTKSSKIKNSNRILEIKTTQTAALKQVIERISTVASDCPIVFIPPDNSVAEENQDDDYYEDVESQKNDKRKNKVDKSKKKSKIINQDNSSDDNVLDPQMDGVNRKKQTGKKKDSGGIRILKLSEDKTILIKLILYASEFEYFRCDEPKITIGVDMSQLNQMLKLINDDDPILIYMNRDNRSSLYIKSLSKDNDNSLEETDLEIFLMELPNTDMPIPATKFKNKISIASDKFHTICKHFNNNSSVVEITSVGNNISFRGKSDGGKATKSYTDNNFHTKKKNSPEHIVQGMYDLKNLICFSKLNKLCGMIDLYLKNDFPLVMIITVATLGKMYVFLTPTESSNT